MKYIVRLVTPKNGTVLDPFAGSGTTLVAAKSLGINYIGIEMEKKYYDICSQRLKITDNPSSVLPFEENND
jgi:site-specific DNA-methyltransferase (adenine-specific)